MFSLPGVVTGLLVVVMLLACVSPAFAQGPTLNSGGIVNAAGFAPAPAPLAAGSIVSLFGAGLATTTMTATTIPLPNTLAGTQVLMNGLHAPLFFVSPGQINAQVPWEVKGNSILSVRVVVNGAQSNLVSANLATAAPGIFTTSTGAAVVVHAADSSLVTPSNPAKPGEYLTIYCTGLGPVSTSLLSGAASPSSPLAHSLNPAIVTIGGVSTLVSFSGLTPGLVGLYQVNVQVPSIVTLGTSVAIALQAGGVAANSTTIAMAGSATTSVQVSPGIATVPVGTTQAFTAIVTNASTTDVVWSVDGIVGGSSTIGTIDTTGLYTAPLTVPSPSTITVTARSVADPTVSSIATITIAPTASVALVSKLVILATPIYGSSSDGPWRISVSGADLRGNLIPYLPISLKATKGTLDMSGGVSDSTGILATFISPPANYSGEAVSVIATSGTQTALVNIVFVESNIQQQATAARVFNRQSESLSLQSTFSLDASSSSGIKQVIIGSSGPTNPFLSSLNDPSKASCYSNTGIDSTIAVDCQNVFNEDQVHISPLDPATMACQNVQTFIGVGSCVGTGVVIAACASGAGAAICAGALSSGFAEEL